MPYAINLTLAPDTADAIEGLYARLAGFKIPDHDLVTQYGPCITILVVGDGAPAGAVARMLELRLPALERLAVTFTEPCIIVGSPPTLSVRVGVTDGLLALHSALYSEFPEGEVHLHYRPAYWQPHLKLCNIRENHVAAAELVAAVKSGWRKLSGMAEGLEAIHYPQPQPIWRARLPRGAEAKRDGAEPGA